ncbi:hypothetical protein C8J57DRAFT_1527027 [Mycena rebaudengoi]|nr:hypothetical protein C8J57DRAFT_1527027 [Mycena rebaudengoi]
MAKPSKSRGKQKEPASTMRIDPLVYLELEAVESEDGSTTDDLSSLSDSDVPIVIDTSDITPDRAAKRTRQVIYDSSDDGEEAATRLDPDDSMFTRTTGIKSSLLGPSVTTRSSSKRKHSASPISSSTEDTSPSKKGKKLKSSVAGASSIASSGISDSVDNPSVYAPSAVNALLPSLPIIPSRSTDLVSAATIAMDVAPDIRPPVFGLADGAESSPGSMVDSSALDFSASDCPSTATVSSDASASLSQPVFAPVAQSVHHAVQGIHPVVVNDATPSIVLPASSIDAPVLLSAAPSVNDTSSNPPVRDSIALSLPNAVATVPSFPMNIDFEAIIRDQVQQSMLGFFRSQQSFSDTPIGSPNTSSLSTNSSVRVSGASALRGPSPVAISRPVAHAIPSTAAIPPSASVSDPPSTLTASPNVPSKVSTDLPSAEPPATSVFPVTPAPINLLSKFTSMFASSSPVPVGKGKQKEEALEPTTTSASGPSHSIDADSGLIEPASPGSVSRNPPSGDPQLCLEDLETYKNNFNPKAECGVFDLLLQDEALRELYVGLPPLPSDRWVLATYDPKQESSEEGTIGGHLSFSYWKDNLQGASPSTIMSIMSFTRSDFYINPSRISPALVVTAPTTSSSINKRMEIDGCVAISLMAGICTESNITAADWERWQSFICLVFGYGVLFSPIVCNALHMGSSLSQPLKDERKPNASLSKNKISSFMTSPHKSPKAPSWKSSPKTNPKSTAPLRYTLGHDEDVPTFDARGIDFDFNVDIPNMATKLKSWTGEIPLQSFIVAGYTASTYITNVARPSLSPIQLKMRYHVGFRLDWSLSTWITRISENYTPTIRLPLRDLLLTGRMLQLSLKESREQHRHPRPRDAARGQRHERTLSSVGEYRECMRIGRPRSSLLCKVHAQPFLKDTRPLNTPRRPLNMPNPDLGPVYATLILLLQPVIILALDPLFALFPFLQSLWITLIH